MSEARRIGQAAALALGLIAGATGVLLLILARRLLA